MADRGHSRIKARFGPGLRRWRWKDVEVFDWNKSVQFVDHHWNQSTMLKQSREVGFRLLALTELPDAPGRNPRSAPLAVLESVKLSRSGSVKLSRSGKSNSYRPASIDQQRIFLIHHGRAGPSQSGAYLRFASGCKHRSAGG